MAPAKALAMHHSSVKALVDAGITSLPPEYIQQQQQLQAADEQDVQALQVPPVLDLSKDPELQRSALADGCHNWGLFQVLGHGIPVQLMDNVRSLVTRFFDLPAEERAAYRSEDKNRTFKVGTSHNSTTEKSMHWHDYMYQVCNPPPNEDELPKGIPNYREITSEYNKRVGQLVKKLLGAVSEHLGLETGALEARAASPWRYTMRMNYYPPCPNPTAAIGLGRHADLGIISILQQEDGVEGLQVLHNEQWVNVSPIPGALVVILGEQMEILANGKLKSTEHRAIVNTSKPRISIVSFILPDFDCFIAPLDELLVDSPQKLRGMKFQEYYDIYFGYLYSGKRVLENLKL